MEDGKGMGGKHDEDACSKLEDGKYEQMEKEMIRRGYCSGGTKEEHKIAKEGQRNLYLYVWSTGGVEFARKETRHWK